MPLYRYKLHNADGADAGEAHYAVRIEPGEEILTGDGRKLRVLDVVGFEGTERSPYVGMLKIEPAKNGGA
jgi:hypothetical protein